MTRLPIGDVIMYGVYKSVDNNTPTFVYKPTNGYTSIAQSQLWWCPQGDLVEFWASCDEWLRNGFSLHKGTPGAGTLDRPEVITYDWQERRVGSRFSVSSRGDTALVGDIMVWLEIVDTELAYNYMTKHGDIPCAVRCDFNEYSMNERYRQVFDIANELFIYYSHNDKPKDVLNIISDDDLVKQLYDI